MFKMISKIPHEYPWGVKRNVGEEFSAETEHDANFLVAYGMASLKPTAEEVQHKGKSGRRARASEN
jgi:hypothetical protein